MSDEEKKKGMKEPQKYGCKSKPRSQGIWYDRETSTNGFIGI